MVELVPAKQNGTDGGMLEVHSWWLNTHYVDLYVDIDKILFSRPFADNDPKSSFRCSCDTSCPSKTRLDAHCMLDVYFF